MRANRDEPDPRRRSVIPAYSGVRGSPDLKANSIALDGSSLIILASLDLIELVTARWIVTIAHSTLGWLFGERQRLAFHQPSRLAFAHRMSRALRSEEHPSELQSLMRTSYAVFCLQKKKQSHLKPPRHQAQQRNR